MISRTARLCEVVLRTAKPRKGGVRQVGRKWLARRLGVSERTVSRCTAELIAAGRLHRTPPRRERVDRGSGWASVEVNRYRLLEPPNPYPHVHKPSSARGDMGVTSPTSWGEAGARRARPARPRPTLEEFAEQLRSRGLLA